MNWRPIPGKDNLIESDEDYTILRDTRHTPPMYLAFKRQWEKVGRNGEKRWAPPIVLGRKDTADEARSLCEQHHCGEQQ